VSVGVTAIQESASVPYIACGPERFLHVEEIGGTTAAVTGTMRTGPWVRDDRGTPCVGTLGVFADAAWAGAATACRPSGLWSVSTELSMSFGAPLPDDGSLLFAAGSVTYQDGHSAIAIGAVRTADGRCLAVGTTRARFVPGNPIFPSHADAARDPVASGVVDWLGLEFAPDGQTAGLLAREHVTNPAANVHGGVLFCVSELAATRAVDAEGRGLAVSSMTVLYLRRAPVGEGVSCETEIVHRGRTAAGVLVRCRRPDGNVAALATVNFGPVAASKG
jgi:acyl-coenzyme A thioesterase PaaI-like protein